MVTDEAERLIKRAIPKLNAAAAAYLIDLAKAVDLVTGQLVLTGYGKVARTIGGTSDAVDLNVPEKPFYLAIFLDCDALVLAQVAAACRRLKRFTIADLAKDGAIEAAFRNALAVFIERASLIQERVALKRQLADLPASYKGRTHEHKLDIRIKLLEQVGMLDRRGNYYEANSSIDALAEMATDLPLLAKEMSQSSGMDLAVNLLRKPGMRDVAPEEITVGLVAAAFAQIEGRNGRLTAISAAEFLIASRFFEAGSILASSVFDQALNRISKGDKPPLRLHLDRNGKRTLFSMDKATLVQHSG